MKNKSCKGLWWYEGKKHPNKGKSLPLKICKKKSKTMKRLFKEGKIESWNKINLPKGEVIEVYKKYKSIYKTANYFDCSISPITRILVENKIKRDGTKKWSKEKTEFLKENYPNLFNKELSDKLEFPITAVADKANRLGLKKDKEIYKKIERKKIYHTEEEKKHLKEKWANNPERQREVIERMKKDNPMKNPVTAKKVSKKKKELWQNEAFAKKMFKALAIKPNKPETFLLNLFKQYNLPFYYVGDGQLIVNGRCPDFVCNPSKKVILMHGDYWHFYKLKKKNPELTREQVEQEDIAHYKKNFFDCLIIWEHELKNPLNVVSKINEFYQKEE